MRKLFISIWFEVSDRECYSYTGFVTYAERNGKIVISPSKIFKYITGRDMPTGTMVIL